MARAIDGDELLGIERLLDTDVVRKSKTASWLLDQVLHDIQAMPTLTPPNEWVSVEERLPEPGERVLAAKGTFVGEAYLASNGAWMRHDGFPWEVDAWMPLPAPPGKDNNVPTNEPLTLEQLREVDGEPVWFDTIKRWGIVKVCRDGVFVLTKSEEFEVGRCKYYRRPPEEKHE